MFFLSIFFSQMITELLVMKLMKSLVVKVKGMFGSTEPGYMLKTNQIVLIFFNQWSIVRCPSFVCEEDQTHEEIGTDFL